jgi:hypothetical protein
MQIGVVLNPESWARWPEAQRLLEPARIRGGLEKLLHENELLWAVLDGDELLACATAVLVGDGDCEVVLVGGRERHRWLSELDRRLGAAAAEAGATRLTAYGRRGWLRGLMRQGWVKLGERDGTTAYARDLET